MSFHPNDIARRTRLSSYALGVGFVLLLSAFFRAQVIQSASYVKQSQENRLRTIPLPAPRGIIYDRKGNIIAENLPAYAVSLTAPSLDSLTPEALGAGAVAMTVVGYLASWLKAVFFADNIALNAFFFFLGKWIFDVIYFSIEQRLGGIELIQQLLLWSPLSAAATAIAGILLLLIMRPLLEPSKV